MLERSATADLIKHTLSRISTVFGQLAYLSSLRDLNTGTYRHHGLAASFGRDESVKALREGHARVFEEWLMLGVREKNEELRAYLEGLDGPLSDVVSHWLSARPYRTFVPASAHKGEAELFLQDLDLLLRLVNSSGGGGGRDPDSSRPV